jgi:hypothetical protein
MGQQGPGQGLETGGATPLADAMVKLLDEFVYKEERFVTQRPQQNPEKGEERRNEEGKKEHDVAGSFNPRYMYDAMKEKRQLKPLLVCSRNQDAPFCYWFEFGCREKDGQQQDAEVFLRVFLDALDEELVGLYTYISSHKPASAPSVDELEGETGESQSAVGKSEVGKRELRDYTVRQCPLFLSFCTWPRRCWRMHGHE